MWILSPHIRDYVGFMMGFCWLRTTVRELGFMVDTFVVGWVYKLNITWGACSLGSFSNRWGLNWGDERSTEQIGDAKN